MGGTSPGSNTVAIYIMLTKVSGGQTNCEIKLIVPIKNSGKVGFDCILHVASTFNDLTLNPTTKQCFKALKSTLQIIFYKMTPSNLTGIMQTPNLKNDDGIYKNDAFLCIYNTTFNFMAAGGCQIAAGDCMFLFMHLNKKKSAAMSPQPFLAYLEKASQAMKLLARYYEKELSSVEAKISLFLFLSHKPC